MYIIESQSDHQPSAASVIDKKRPQTESLILSGEEKRSLGRTENRTGAPFAKIQILKDVTATRAAQRKHQHHRATVSSKAALI